MIVAWFKSINSIDSIHFQILECLWKATFGEILSPCLLVLCSAVLYVGANTQLSIIRSNGIHWYPLTDGCRWRYQAGGASARQAKQVALVALELLQQAGSIGRK